MPQQHHWAVVVGIDRYPDYHPTDQLQCARRGAQAFYDWLRNPEGGDVPTDNIKPIIKVLPATCTRAEAKPTEDEIVDAIKWVIGEAKANNADWDKTRFYLFLAGHGIAITPEDAALLPADARNQDFTRHVSCLGLHNHVMLHGYFQEMVVFADCCREYQGHRIIVPNSPYQQENQVGGDVKTLRVFATAFRKRAFEEVSGPPDERYSYFTRCLLEVLNNRTRGATLNGEELERRMRELTVKMSKVAHVDLKIDPTGHFEEDIIFGITSNTPEYLVRFEVDPSISHFRILDNDRKVLNNFTVNGATNEIRLPLGFYELEVSMDGGKTFAIKEQGLDVVPGFNQEKIAP